MKDIVWLFIDENGNECITDLGKPRRVKDDIGNFTKKPEYWLDNKRYLSVSNCEWYNIVKDSDYDLDGCDISCDYVILPKGTIKKLINKDLSFYDEPYEYIG